MKVKELLEFLKDINPESRIIIDDPNEGCHEIEYVGIEKDY